MDIFKIDLSKLVSPEVDTFFKIWVLFMPWSRSSLHTRWNLIDGRIFYCKKYINLIFIFKESWHRKHSSCKRVKMRENVFVDLYAPGIILGFAAGIYFCKKPRWWVGLGGMINSPTLKVLAPSLFGRRWSLGTKLAFKNGHFGSGALSLILESTYLWVGCVG